MSEALFEFGGLRFWNEEEIMRRGHLVERLSQAIIQRLFEKNRAWHVSQMEGPCLLPLNLFNKAYTDKDIFVTNHVVGNQKLGLRAETTQSTYQWAKIHIKKYPWCVWQVGKSFRREMNDGASAAKLRFNEFTQLEFQCIYPNDTKADYREAVVEVLKPLFKDCRIIDSDRLPPYSESTKDIEIYDEANERWVEIASISIRKDFSETEKVLEIAFGLDRLVELGY